MLVSVGGYDMVLVSGEYPWRFNSRRLVALARRDPHVALGLDIYNALDADNPRTALGALAYYNDAVMSGSPCGRRVAGVVREAARCKIASMDPDPFVLGISLRPPKSIRRAAKKIGKAAYKVSRSPALPIVAAALPGVGPGVAGGIVAYQGAMKAYDLAQAGKGTEALAQISMVANAAAEGNPKAQAALANIKKGAAIVKDVQKMGKASPAEVAKLISSRAGVDVQAVAKAYGVPVNKVTTSAISKVAQGQFPSLVRKPPGAKSPAAAKAAMQILATRGKTPSDRSAAKLLRGVAAQAAQAKVVASPGTLVPATQVGPGKFVCQCCAAHGGQLSLSERSPSPVRRRALPAKRRYPF